MPINNLELSVLGFGAGVGVGLGSVLASVDLPQATCATDTELLALHDPAVNKPQEPHDP